MKKPTSPYIFILFVFSIIGCKNLNRIEINSPDGKISLSVFAGDENGQKIYPSFSINENGKQIILTSMIHLETGWKTAIDEYELQRIVKQSVTNQWENSFGERKTIPDNYNEVKFFLQKDKNKLNLICRVFNEGVAFAYEFPEQTGMDSVTIRDEKIIYRFPKDYPAWSASRAQAQYSKVAISKIETGCERPLVIEYDSSTTIALAEAGLIDYARMKFEPVSGDGIAIRTRLGGEVRKKLPFQSPWRVIMIGKSPGDLLEKNYLLSNLNSPSELSDISWIKPGKVLREVTLTTSGAKTAIDFVAAHKMQYVEFDAGWYGPENNDNSDATKPVLDPARSKGPFDLKEIVSYANSKNIKVLLYVNRKSLEQKLDSILPLFNKWGIAGIKFGFVQVGTQPVTAWMHNAIIKAASNHLVVDVHDEYRPTGWSRTYPNFLTQEGIRGDEESPTNHHTLITMFTRMLAGPGDNTICYYDKRVDEKMGSHASQLAKAVCLFSPLQFLYWYDKPVPAGDKTDLRWNKPNYTGDEPELEFFDEIPTTWDETRVLYGKIGEFGIIARKKGDDWFIGGINAEQARTLELNFSFLDPGVKYSTLIFSDDSIVNTRTHVRIDRKEIDRSSVYPAILGPNKGFAMHLKPLR
jgi:alpha-glucosidase